MKTKTKTKIVAWLSVLACTLALVGTAAAQDRPRTTGTATAPSTSFTFGDENVEGGRVQSEGERIETRSLGRRHTLVRPRVHFINELVTSVERI